MTTRRKELSQALAAGSCLIDSSSTPQSNLKSVLLARLNKYYSCLNTASSSVNESSSLEVVQLTIANEALAVIETVQRLVDINPDGLKKENEELLLGTRDLSQLRTLLSITFRWGIEALSMHVVSSLPSTSSATPVGSRIIDLTSTPDDYKYLSDMLDRLLALVFPGGVQERMSVTLITETLLHKHATDLMKPAIILGWLPKSLTTESIVPVDHVRPLIMRLLTILSPAEAIMALGNVMSSINSIVHVRRTCGYLLSKQLLRPEGVRGLCAAVFGDAENIDETQLEKLQHIARVLSTPPSGMKVEEYFSTVAPRILGLLKDENHPAYKRAAAFTLSQMLSVEDSPAAIAVLTSLHGPILRETEKDSGDPQNPHSAADVDDTLTTLTILIANSDPSPNLIQTVLSPVIAVLYAHLYRLDALKTSDPFLKESVQGLLLTWSKIVSLPEAIKALSSILEDSENVSNVNPERLSLFTPEDLKQADESGELEPNSNILNLYPDPRHFVGFLKSINRSDVLSDFFVHLLEAYRNSRKRAEDNPLKTLLYLQMIIQIQTVMSEGSSASEIFKRPTQVLEFVRQALDTPPSLDTSSIKNQERRPQLEIGSNNHLGDDGDPDEGSDSADSDDELPDSERYTADDEMTETAINLLLSLLEANKDLSARTEPSLNDIFSLLEHHALNGPEAVRNVAREARMVMTVRLAGETSVPTNNNSNKTSSDNEARETYQQALKLLQDPILPVRAHGLLLLRQLVSPKSPPLDPALLPAIQEIFFQSVHDDDSYIFLNAVQGLVALVDRTDGAVLKKLVSEYTKGLDSIQGSTMAQQEVDVRVRMGEALSSVIRQCGDALSIHGSVIIPSLWKVIRSSHTPTTLKTSSLSLLADCQGTHSLSLLPYFVDLSEGMNDLLQVEMVTYESRKDEMATGTPAPTIDQNPTSTNPKFPPLRRAALHLLSVLFQGTIRQIYDSSFGISLFSFDLVRRLRITLSYISGTDEDILVRVMAREALEQLNQLEQAAIGL
ncbi:hypothetical protein K435DRAFT_772052 [Dendrothele bispora CBS 962.96]|uniref:Uncharacterized protein n=1 Tax=Dendrothele bispora (strain CBS 962.96) TaxID=1314807 RepID=A0A4S8MYP8_DENBC|nr:hypothetical protein K435DRAFT_772052 [Dendrothele bispora CBS 962.96]